MRLSLRNALFAYAGAAVTALALMLAACTNVKIDSQPAAAPKSAPSASGQQETSEPRTNEIFDKVKYKGMLAIRYLYLNSNVGAGDAIVIQSPDGKTMMIDAGIIGTGGQVVQYLDRLGIDTIDIALNTHPHADHIGGFASVFGKKKIGKFYMENVAIDAGVSHKRVLEIVKEKAIPYEYLEEGASFTLGSDVKVELFGPPKGELPGAIQSYNDAKLNYYSMVIKVTYKNQSFLFPGDIYKDMEEKLIAQYGDRLKADYLHAPHHGEVTSSSPKFIEKVSPKVAVLSSNIWVNMPLLERLERGGTKAYNTGINKNILIVSDGKKLQVIPEKDRPAQK